MSILKFLNNSPCITVTTKKRFAFLIFLLLLTIFFNENIRNMVNSSAPVHKSVFPTNILSHLPNQFQRNASQKTVAFINLPPGDSCNEDSLLVILVKSAFDHVRQRAMIRRTWASVGVKNAKTFFLLGISTTEKENVNLNISEEAAKHNDIIQGGFIDAYCNLTRKTLMGFEWLNYYCSNAKLVMSVDDDTFVDISNVLRIYNLSAVNGLLDCGTKLAEHARVRRRGKWAVPRNIYKPRFYPPYCTGDCYVLSGDVAKDIFMMSLKTNLNMTIDDVVVTGIFREKVGIKINKVQHNVCYYLDNAQEDITKKIYEKWLEVKERKSDLPIP